MSKKRRDGEHLSYNDSLEQEKEYYEDLDDPLPETDNKRWELDVSQELVIFRKEFSKCMNEEGIDSVMSWLRFSLMKTSALTNLNDKEINDLLRFEIGALIDDLRVNNKKWEIKNPAARSKIIQWVFGCMKKQLKRAYNDGERKYRSDSYGYNEMYRHDEVRPDEIGRGGGGLFGLFGGRRKSPPQMRDYEDERF